MTVETPHPPAAELDWSWAGAWLARFSAEGFKPGVWAGGGQVAPNVFSTRWVDYPDDVDDSSGCSTTERW